MKMNKKIKVTPTYPNPNLDIKFGNETLSLSEKSIIRMNNQAKKKVL